MFRHLYCLLSGHTDQHLRNLSGSESAPLPEVSVYRCSTCGREIRMAGWQPAPTPQTPVGEMHFPPGTPELPAEGASDATVS